MQARSPHPRGRGVDDVRHNRDALMIQRGENAPRDRTSLSQGFRLRAATMPADVYGVVLDTWRRSDVQLPFGGRMALGVCDTHTYRTLPCMLVG